jgi:predicted nucleic acid-binding protein
MSADARRFTIDTNVLVYSVDRRAGQRHELARAIVDRAADYDCWLTLQAVSEFYAVATRKGVMPAAKAAELGHAWLATFPHAAASVAAVRRALTDAAAGRLSYWDALILAAAAEAGCSAILTEDMADGQRFGAVEIVNPFGVDGVSPRAAALLGTT